MQAGNSDSHNLMGRNLHSWVNILMFLTLKKISKMCELEPARRTMERNVLTHPLSTAGPILVSASWTRLFRLPVNKMVF